jgi:ADP-ribose pyrophosphatase YjhB (NUDIX family)
MSRFSRIVPEGENRERVSCLDCGHVFYENPKVVVGALVAHEERVLLCRRAIEPRRGFWTLPAGYLELNETPAEGAVRETLEEAGASIAIDGILAIYSISRIAQVQIIHRARFADPDRPFIQAGQESLDVGMFGLDEIPREDIAFPTVLWAIDAFRRIGDNPLGAPDGNPHDDPRGEATLPGAKLQHEPTDLLPDPMMRRIPS